MWPIPSAIPREREKERDAVRVVVFLLSVDEQPKLVISILTEWIGMGRSGTLSSAKLQLLKRISLVMVSLSLLLQPGERTFWSFLLCFSKLSHLAESDLALPTFSVSTYKPIILIVSFPLVTFS